jgi:hypothetical protein
LRQQLVAREQACERVKSTLGSSRAESKFITTGIHVDTHFKQNGIIQAVQLVHPRLLAHGTPLQYNLLKMHRFQGLLISLKTKLLHAVVHR